MTRSILGFVLALMICPLAWAGDMQNAARLLDRDPSILSEDWTLKGGFYFFVLPEADEEDWILAERLADIVAAACSATRQNINLSYNGPLHIFSRGDDQGIAKKIYVIRQDLLDRSLGLPC
jgi:hypothetical protein